jgi:hypothetical protein
MSAAILSFRAQRSIHPLTSHTKRQTSNGAGLVFTFNSQVWAVNFLP